MLSTEAVVTSEWMTATQAQRELGLTTNKMAAFLADGTLPHVRHPRDKRKKYVKREDMERLKQELSRFPASKRAS